MTVIEKQFQQQAQTQTMQIIKIAVHWCCHVLSISAMQ